MSQRHRFDRFELRLDERQLLVDGRPAVLDARALDLLCALIERKGRLVTNEELLRGVWPGLVVEQSDLQTQVSALRSLLGPKAIVAIPGRGYRWAMSVDGEAAIEASEPVPSSAGTAAITVERRDDRPSSPPHPPDASGAAQPVRKLAAILSADVVGYSRLMGENDRATLEAIIATRKVMGAHIARHGGRVVDATGDSLLGDFPSAIESVRCAVAIQGELAQRNSELPEARRMVLRIGLNVGDVIEQDAALYGEGVNVAARLQALGEPGGVCLSGSIFDQVEGKLPLGFRFAGEQAVKNIAKPVRAYHVRVGKAVDGTGAQASQGPEAHLPGFRFGKVVVRPGEHQLLVDGESARIGSRAFDVLVALIERRARVVSKNELLELVWPDVVVGENNLQMQISSLRKLLGPHVIETIPGLGYRFIAVLEDEAGVAPAPASPEATVVSDTGRLTNLPAAAVALFGRSADIDTLGELVTECRLVTILGPGGIGKTSLAQALARALLGRCCNGVWWVDLASVISADGVALAIAQGANVQLGEGDTTVALLNGLRARESILILDNCERLLGEIAQLVQAMLAAAPRLRIVATSQETLRVQGEHVYRLNPLVVPSPASTVDEARACSALQLLEQRARAADRHFSLNDSNVAVAIRLCRRLDGNPLAIEMAAARLLLMGVTELEASLGERLRLLKGTQRGAPARHRTLRATLDWSHALLTSEEQAVLRRLSAFVGGFRLDMARRVAISDQLDEWAVLDHLAALVDKSLVQLESCDPPRYRLLETTRVYAAEQLAEHHEAGWVTRQHAKAMALLAGEAEQAYWDTPDVPWLDRYSPHYDDFKTAFDRACQARDAEVGSATLDALFQLDHLRAIFAPIRSNLHAAFELLPTAAPIESARLNLRLSAYFLGGVERVPRHVAALRAATSFREIGDQRRLYEALMSLAVTCAMVGKFEDAQAALAEATEIEDPRWPPRLQWLGASHRTKVHTYRGDAAAYREGVRAELHFAERAGSPCQAANARLNLADAALMAGELDEAIALGRAVVAEVRVLNLPQMLATAQLNLFAALLRKGDMRSARAVGSEALSGVWQNNLSGYFLCHLSLLAASIGQHECAAQMLGYVDAWFAINQSVAEPSEARSRQLACEAIEATLASSAIGPLRRIGALMNETQAHALAEAMLSGSQQARYRDRRAAAS